MPEEESAKESVQDYPRPPKIEVSNRQIRVKFNGEMIADSVDAKRVLEKSLPPSYYIPPEDIRMEYLEPSDKTTLCEWKGEARYYDVIVGNQKARNAVWYYPEPTDRFEPLKDHLAFYPAKMDGCYVDDEKVEPQESGYYGGWITSDITGPFKNNPGISES